MESVTSNTGNNRKPGTFTKGDKRINRKGRPRSFDALRKLAQDIAHEELQAGDASMTTTEAILRKWASSKDPRLQMEFMAVAYGRTPNTTEHANKDDKPFKTESTVNHAIDSESAKNIFDILAATGAIQAVANDATDDGVYIP